MDDQQWHTVEAAAALANLESDRDCGLSSTAVEQRQAEYGPNAIQETGGRSRLRILLDQFTNVMLLMLIGVAVISGVLSLRAGETPKDAIAIFAIVLLNAVLGYLQENRAEQALSALKQLSAPAVRTLRQGEIREVPAAALVPGDIILLEAGDQVAADGRLLEAANLQARESALTGEAQAVTKKAEIVLEADAALGDRKNLVFQGTEIVQGRAQVLVTRTGMKTELGRIADMLQGVEAEDTPLQRRMGQLSNALVLGSLILVAIVVIGGVVAMGWQAFEELLTVSLSMAVAVVPEGLPAVITVTLAIGTQRMVRRQALIRRLPAVETLGSVTTICSDKTGTLTQNKMVVQSVHTPSGGWQVSGEGYAPEGNFLQAEESIQPLEQPVLALLLLDCVLCNDAVLQKQDGEWAIMGDPTEGSLVVLAGKAGLEQQPLSYQFKRRAEFPFSSERKRMSVAVEAAEDSRFQFDSPYLLLAKGSPEILLDYCNAVAVESLGETEAMERGWRDLVLQTNERLAGQGMRVLGFAARPLTEIPDADDPDAAERDLVWLGMVGLIDAPRPEVREAVKRCRQAGIRPVMITGDHPLTARALAIDLGISETGAEALRGQQLEQMSQPELEEAVQRVSVYARVAPEHKLRIVQALQKQHQVVAMTGDGVNDAPALKQADIGIAMGITGTDVSKEASDMVLLDDNFASIVAATEEGRVVYSNIRRFIKYILGSNIGEVLTIALSPLLLPVVAVPLTPLQILWMNLVTDGFPALALAVEPPEPNVMNRPPYDPQESIFARGLGFYMVRIGIIFGIIAIMLMLWAYDYAQTTPGDPDRWKTMVFTMLCLSQMGHAIAVRSDRRLAVEMSPFSNPFILLAVGVTTLLQLALVYVPPLRNFFGTHALTLTELAVCFGFSTLIFVWVELEKLFIRAWMRSHRPVEKRTVQ